MLLKCILIYQFYLLDFKCLWAFNISIIKWESSELRRIKESQKKVIDKVEEIWVKKY